MVRSGFALAGGNRPGPVLIDLPKDIQQHVPRDPEGRYVAPRIPAVIDAPESSLGGIAEPLLKQCVRMIAEAERPVIYASGGIISSGTEAQLVALAEKLGCPVTTTLIGLGEMSGHAGCRGYMCSAYMTVLRRQRRRQRGRYSSSPSACVLTIG